MFLAGMLDYPNFLGFFSAHEMHLEVGDLAPTSENTRKFVACNPDGINPAPPGMVLKPCASWDKLPINAGFLNHQQSHFVRINAIQFQ